MLEFAHALTGATIAYRIQNPVISLPLALLSHSLVDLLPHWNFVLDKERKKLGKISKKTIFWLYLDSFTGLSLGLLLAFKALPHFPRFLTIIAAAFLAVLPDLIEAPYFFFNYSNKLIDKIIALQKKLQWNIPFWPGIITQIFFASLLLSLTLL